MSAWPGRVRALVIWFLAGGSAWCALWMSSPAFAADPVPCDPIGGGKFACDWWRTGDGIGGGAIVVAGGRVVGYLHRGRNWIICQARGGNVTNSAGDWNHWYGWTVADNGARGWASALDARGGSDYGQFRGVPLCDGAPGPAPQASGTWQTAPPSSAQPLGGTTPQQAPSQGVVHRAGQPITIGDNRCTSAFPIRIGRRLLGLTAGHCALGQGRTVTSGDGTPLGRIVNNAAVRRGSDIDALVFGAASTPGTPRWAQEIARGDKPPVRVGGIVRTADQRVGMRVCFAGKTSGSDRCGYIGSGVRTRTGLDGVRSKHICAAGFDSIAGDSGGPVYAYGEAGRARAVGVIRGGTSEFDGPSFCYVPIEEILKEFGARLAQIGRLTK